MLLVPAVMSLIGHRNWWAPRPLRRLHDRFGLSEEPSPEPVTTVPDAPAPGSAAIATGPAGPDMALAGTSRS